MWLARVAPIVLAMLAATALAQRPRPTSPSGRYTLTTIEAAAGGISVEVRRVGGALVTRIDPNPGGIVSRGRSDVRFVADDNVLVSWGCGTYCSSAALFAPDGRALGAYGLVDVSPDGSLRIAYSPFDAPMASTVGVVDLRTDHVLSSQPSDDAWNTCRVVWTGPTARLQRCSTRTPRSVTILLPRAPP